VLRPLVLDGVGGEIHGADVVTIDERALGERAVELRQELSKPGRLRHAISDSTYSGSWSVIIFTGCKSFIASKNDLKNHTALC